MRDLDSVYMYICKLNIYQKTRKGSGAEEVMGMTWELICKRGGKDKNKGGDFEGNSEWLLKLCYISQFVKSM